MAEYVRLSGLESVYAQKRLLHSELGLLETVRRANNYKKLRNEEFVLRLALKKIIGELLEELELLDKSLPQDKLPGLAKENKPKEKQSSEEKGVLSLEQELEIIRRKIERLDGGI